MFVENLELIQRHNEEHANGLHTFTLGVNKFADYTYEEYRMHLGFKPTNKKFKMVLHQTVGHAPDDRDWRHHVSLADFTGGHSR